MINHEGVDVEVPELAMSVLLRILLPWGLMDRIYTNVISVLHINVEIYTRYLVEDGTSLRCF